MKRLLSAFAATTLVAAAPAPSAIDDAGAILESYAAAWARADGEALAKLYSNDAELISVAGAANGRPEIAGLYKAAFASGMAGTILTTKLDAARAIAPGAAYARGTWTIASPHRAGSVPYCGRFFAALKKVGGQYQIVSFSEVQLACDSIS